MDTMTKLEPSTSRNDLWQVTLTKSRVAAHLGVTTSWKILKNYCVRIETESCKHIIYDIYRGSKMQRKAKSKGVYWKSSRDPHRSWEFQLVIFGTWKGEPANNKPSDDHCLAGLVCRRLQQPRRRATPSLTPCDALWSSTLGVPVVTWNAGMSCIGEPAEL